jgi:hypothetical protein
MDVGVLIPNDDSVRLLVYVLQQLDLRFLYEAYNGYREEQRRREAERKAPAVEKLEPLGKGTGKGKRKNGKAVRR